MSLEVDFDKIFTTLELKTEYQGDSNTIKPKKVKELMSDEGFLRYERLDNAVSIEGSFDEDKNNFKIIFAKNGLLGYDHTKVLSVIGGRYRYVHKEGIQNPLINKYNYESIKEYLEDDNVTDDEMVEFIRNACEEYSQVLDKRGEWKDLDWQLRW